MKRKIGVILSYCLMIIEVLSTLLLTPYIIRTLGDAEYGVYKLTASIVAYLLLLDLGIGNAVIRYVSKYRAENDKEKVRHFLGIATVFYGTVAAICLIIGIVLTFVFPIAFSKGLSNEEISLGQKLLLITTLNSAVTLGISGYKNTIAAYERYDILKGVSILFTILRIVLTVVLLKCGLGSIGLVSINFAITLSSAFIFIAFVLKGLHISPIYKGNDSKLIKEIIVYCSFILLQMIATQLNSCLDSVLIGAFVKSSSTLIAVYSVGQQITQYFQTIGSAVNGVIMPGIVRMVESKASPQQMTGEMVRIGRIIFMVLGIIWSGFLIYGKQFIDLWVGESKAEAYWVALLFMTAYLFILTESIGTQILWAMNEHKEQSIIKFSIVLVNIILTIILIYWKPILGATIGTFISLFLGDIVVMNFVFVKKIKINLTAYYCGLFKGIVPCLIITAISGCLFSFVGLSGWFGFFINIVFMVAIYCILLLILGMNTYEKNLINGIFASLKRIKKSN